MDKALANALALVHLAWLPIRTLVAALLFLLSPLLRAVLFLLSPIAIVAGFLLLPFIHLAKAVLYLVTLPLQLKWLERIETLYIFLGTAALIGCMTGAVLYFIASFLSSSLSMDATSKVTLPRPRTTVDFRIEQGEKQAPLSPARPNPSHAVSDRPLSSRRRGLLSQTIVEEEDSDL